MLFVPPLKVLKGESNGSRIVRLLTEVLSDGPLGQYNDRASYARLVSCGLDVDGGAKLATVRTSCAIFARAIHHWAGRPAKHPWVVGWPMFGGWLGDLSFRHVAWRPYSAQGPAPEPGDLFYIDHPVNPNNNHVGFFVRPIGGKTWLTAEGGGGDGTLCRFGSRELGPFFDTSRRLRGWWSANALTLGAPPGAEVPVKVVPRLCEGAPVSIYVGIVQALVGAKPDKIFGPKTAQAVRKFQQNAGRAPSGCLEPDEVRRMVADWQQQEGLPATGQVDEPTEKAWARYAESLR